MIFTMAVLAYQLFFVGVLYIAGRFGRTQLKLVLLLCLLWTATHIFLLPLAVLQTSVILVSYVVFRRRHHPQGTRGGDQGSLSLFLRI